MEQDKKNKIKSEAGYQFDENDLPKGSKTPTEIEQLCKDAQAMEDTTYGDKQPTAPLIDETRESAGQVGTSDQEPKIKKGKFKVTLQDEEQQLPKDNVPSDGAKADASKESLEPAEGTEKPKSRKHKVIHAIIYSFSIVLVSAALAVAILFSVTDYLGMLRPEASANIKIPTGASTAQIAEILKDDGIIRSSTIFRAYMAIAKKHGLKDGTYPLNSHMSYNEIVRTLRNTANRATVTVTIPEGYTLQEIAELLEKNSVCSQSDFLKSADSASISFDFQSAISNDEKRFYRLEGYLFPDTYEFYIDQSSDSVVKKMLVNFDKRFDNELRQKAKKSDMTVDQVVTLASIIQIETGKTSEMKKVSSVFHNRLDNGVNGVKMLQSDATVLYAKKSIETSLLSTKTQIASEYNTYEIEGLPSGAICNPGLEAIKAALSPTNTSYYFFVSDKDGNYYYAKTYTQHLKNIKKAQKVGEAGGTDVADK